MGFHCSLGSGRAWYFGSKNGLYRDNGKEDGNYHLGFMGFRASVLRLWVATMS